MSGEGEGAATPEHQVRMICEAVDCSDRGGGEGCSGRQRSESNSAKAKMTSRPGGLRERLDNQRMANNRRTRGTKLNRGEKDKSRDL